jgi:hypothetical protein
LEYAIHRNTQQAEWKRNEPYNGVAYDSQQGEWPAQHKKDEPKQECNHAANLQHANNGVSHLHMSGNEANTGVIRGACFPLYIRHST